MVVDGRCEGWRKADYGNAGAYCLVMGSPMRSVTRAGFPFCPISQSISIFSTSTLCLSSSYFLTTTNGFSSVSNGVFGQFSSAIFRDIADAYKQATEERRC
ncbi:putative N-acetyltransferase HLS1 [Senna tora]|uniref:Putative N-acetyltransferase HLS1 n=1 Tax=Senna tora TaxID=362788 RepID=A0A834XEV8_9FABA|nr:putative N-acetyltransferase HLS1 [Senna tora]